MADRSRKQSRETARAKGPAPVAGRPGAVPWDTSDRPDAVATAVLVCDLAGTILDVNAQACALLGVERDGVRGRSALSTDLWGDAVVAADGAPLDPAGWLKEAAAANDGTRLDRLLGLRRAGDDALTWLQATSERLHTAQTDATTLFVTLSDVTVMKESRDALERTRRCWARCSRQSPMSTSTWTPRTG